MPFDPRSHNPIGRFSDIASLYARNRPDYPDAAVDLLLAGLDETTATVVEVGAGTGILTRQIAARGFTILALEPNPQMRSEAEANTPQASVRYLSGSAESTGLVSASADLVVAAQAFHWFEPEASLAEFARICKPGGRVVLLWNDADLSDAFTREYWSVMEESTAERDVVREPHHVAGRRLAKAPHFHAEEPISFAHSQTLDEEGLLGRAFSVSFAPRDPKGVAPFADRIRAIFQKFSKAGLVTMQYRTLYYEAMRV